MSADDALHAAPRSPSGMPWRFSERGDALADSAIRALGKRLAGDTRVVSFAGGMPSPATFPVAAFEAAFERVLSREGRAALQYSATDGLPALREWIAASLSTPGARVAPECVLITSGSQQGLDLIGKVFINAGDALAVETPTYLGALQAFGQYAPRFVPLPCDGEGLVANALPTALRDAGMAAGATRLLYAIPSFQNPTGRLMSHARRVELVEACAREALPIIEDDPYGALDHAGRTHTTLLSIAPERVVHLGSFSKVLSPGIRLGWVVAPSAVIRKLELAKQASDLHTSTLAQRVVHDIVAQPGFMAGHLDACRSLYAASAVALRSALGWTLADHAQWDAPEGGMFLWLRLREGLDASALLDRAIEAGVAYVPGAPFYAQAPQRNTLRLCFSTADATQMARGVAALKAALDAV